MRWIALLLVLLALPACQGSGVAPEELPELPIAFSYHDIETARRRAEARAEAEPTQPALPREGIARVEDISRYMGLLLGVAEQERFEDLEKRFPGRLALLDPRRAAAEALPIARPGALPRAWSPGRERLMFTRLVDGYRQLAEWNRETDEVRALTRGPWVYPDGCYGPEERLVLVQAGVVEGRAVARVALSEPRGVRPVAVSEGPSDYAPACAPDGRAVAWVSTKPDGRDVLKVRAPVVDGEVRELGPGRAPAFSPDGEWLVYSARIGDRWALHRIRADGSGRRRIGTGSIDELEASFSPDGRLLVYVGDDGLDQRLYLRRFDGTGDRVLLEAGGGSSPVW